jgi:hypothetical protein
VNFAPPGAGGYDFTGQQDGAGSRERKMKRRICCIGILCVSACKPVELDTYYFQIKNVQLRIPAKYLYSFPGPTDGIECNSDRVNCAQQPPGLNVKGITFQAQDFRTFERYREPKGFQGLSDVLKIGLHEPESFHENDRLPNYAGTWDPEKRDPKNDIYGLQAYKSLKIGADDVNYRYDFGGGTVLHMTCKAFHMPNPHCEAIEPWHGLLLRYQFTHRHLAEWQDLHQRLTNHLNSFVSTLG